MDKTFSSELLLTKMEALQEQNTSLLKSSKKLQEYLQNTEQENHRLAVAVEEINGEKERLVRLLSPIGIGLSLILLLAAVKVFLLAGENNNLVVRDKQLSQSVSRISRENKALSKKLATENKRIQEMLAVVQADNLSLKTELKKAKDNLNGVIEEKTYLEDILIHNNREIEALKKAASTSSSPEALRKLNEAEEEAGRLTEQNRLLSAKLERLYKATQDKISSINAAKIALEQTIADAQKKIDEEWNTVDLGSIKVAPTRSREAAVAAMPAQGAEAVRPELQRIPKKEGHVRAVNLDHGFIVVDLGRVDGLEENNTLYVKKNGQKVATLSVIEARDALSACNLKDSQPGYQIQVNDLVSK